jgi:hypothetical protein
MGSAFPVRKLGVANDASSRAAPGFKRLAWLRWVFGLAGIAFLVITFRETWRRSQGLPIPKAWALSAAGALTLAALFCLARAWIRLLAARDVSRSLAAGFFTSQLGRYIPGAVWQAFAQVGLATDAGVSLRHASTAFGVQALVQVAAGGLLGACLALFGQGVPLIARLLSLVGLLALLVLRRAWLVRALRMVGRVLRRDFADGLVPSQSAILVSFGWTLLAVAANSVAFAMLLASLPGGAPIAESTSAFAFAWLVGFLAVPFPSGIGVREAVLLLTIGFQVPRSHVIAASVSQRLLLIGADLVAIVFSRLRMRARSGSVGRQDVAGS